MNKAILDKIKTIFPLANEYWENIIPLLKYKTIPAKTLLLKEGDVSETLYIILNGCLRLFFIKKDGTEYTSQFFFENQMVSSLESFSQNKPSRFYLESLEETEVIIIHKTNFEKIININETAKNLHLLYLRNRLTFYINLHSSFILDSPEERYVKLIKEYPFIIERIPQYYIASYLGITPVSLSRIRSRLKKKNINNC